MLDEPGATLDAWLDRALLTPDHLWAGGGGLRDPEGLLSTLPAAGTAMLGKLAGRWIGQRERPHPRATRRRCSPPARSAMMLGLMWHWSFPINKSLWTSSYVLFTAGMACVALATIMWIVDVHRVRARGRSRSSRYGMNPMLAFVGSGLMARCIYSIVARARTTAAACRAVEATFRTFVSRWLAPAQRVARVRARVRAVWLAYRCASLLAAGDIIFKV